MTQVEFNEIQEGAPVVCVVRDGKTNRIPYITEVIDKEEDNLVLKNHKKRKLVRHYRDVELCVVQFQLNDIITRNQRLRKHNSELEDIKDQQTITIKKLRCDINTANKTIELQKDSLLKLGELRTKYYNELQEYKNRPWWRRLWK